MQNNISHCSWLLPHFKNRPLLLCQLALPTLWIGSTHFINCRPKLHVNLLHLDVCICRLLECPVTVNRPQWIVTPPLDETWSNYSSLVWWYHSFCWVLAKCPEKMYKKKMSALFYYISITYLNNLTVKLTYIISHFGLFYSGHKSVICSERGSGLHQDVLVIMLKFLSWKNHVLSHFVAKCADP